MYWELIYKRLLKIKLTLGRFGRKFCPARLGENPKDGWSWEETLWMWSSTQWEIPLVWAWRGGGWRKSSPATEYKEFGEKYQLPQDFKRALVLCENMPNIHIARQKMIKFDHHYVKPLICRKYQGSRGDLGWSGYCWRSRGLSPAALAEITTWLHCWHIIDYDQFQDLSFAFQWFSSVL